MGLESLKTLENITDGDSIENISKPLESTESDIVELKCDSKEGVEYFNPGLEKTEVVTDLEMTEGIADYLETVENFKYENWTKLSLEERTELLNSVEQKIAEIEHRPPLTVNTEEMGPRNLGYQCASEKRIALNSKIVALNSPEAHRAVLDTIVHEGRHAYQHYNVDVKCIHESASVVKTWEKNFYDPKWGYYSYHGQKVFVPNNQGKLRDIGFLLYEQQPVEVDARNFASDVLARLESKGIISSEQEINAARINEPSLEAAASTANSSEALNENLEQKDFEGSFTEDEIRLFHFESKMGFLGEIEPGDKLIAFEKGYHVLDLEDTKTFCPMPMMNVNIYKDHWTGNLFINDSVGYNAKLIELTPEQQKISGFQYMYKDMMGGTIAIKSF